YNDNPSKKFYGETLNFYTGYGYGGGVDGEYGPGAGGGPYIILNPGTSPGGSSSSSGGCLPNQILANDGTCVSGEVSGRLGGGGLVPCGVYSSKGGEKIINWQCTFEDIFTLINNVIRFILFNMVVPIAAIMFAYAGFLLITAQGGEAKTKAKGIFTNAVIGLVIAVAAWLIVTTILWILGYKGTVFW
ncbi:MAG TPA: pilin, partial [Gammaproteobacteria bacterium]|nr:pilin [Gammaproteobacteria bacterium]